MITVRHGVPPKRVDIYAKDLRKPDSPIRQGIHGIDNRFDPVNYGDDLYGLRRCVSLRVHPKGAAQLPSTGDNSVRSFSGSRPTKTFVPTETVIG